MRLLCEELLSEAEVTEPPTPLKMIASLRGIREIRSADQPYAGILTPGDAGFTVAVRKGDGHERQRFTIGHETGHTLLPGFRDARQLRCEGPRNWLERMCDVAGSELLLPRRLFSPMMAEGNFDLGTIEAIGEAFEASVEATARRAVALHTGPALLLVLSERHKPTEAGSEEKLAPKLRVDYAVPHGEWPFALRHKSANEKGLGRVLEGEILDGRGNIDELLADEVGPVQISAKRYGRKGKVLALVRRVK